MSKTVIFNNQVYELDENKLAPINAAMVEFLTTELAGTGATIKFNNTTYEVDSAKLSTSKAELVNFLGTIEGEGEVIEIDGVEYSVASSALEGATATVAETLVNLGITPSEGLRYELNEDGASYSLTGIGSCEDTDIIIPAEYEGLPVTSIGFFAFHTCSSLTSITIPDSVMSIGNYAFAYCDSLTSVTIGNGVESIGIGAFDSCHSLTSITVDENNTVYKSIEGNLYSKNGKTLIQYAAGKTDTSFTIPNGVESIGKEAFYNCFKLTSVTIGNGVTSIVEGAFIGCTSLTSITVDESNTAYKSIDGNLYSKDGKTLIQYAIGKTDTSFTIPDSVKSIGSYAFSRCTNITSVTIGKGVKSIGNEAFWSCNSLRSIYINKEENSISGSPWGAYSAQIHWNSTGPDVA